MVHGIVPNTQYYITVVAVTSGNNFDVLLGSASDGINIETKTGGEKIITTLCNVLLLLCSL